MSAYPNNPNEYNQKYNEAHGANYPNQMNQEYRNQLNTVIQPPHNNYPQSSYVGIPQPQPQSIYYVSPQMPQQNNEIPSQVYVQSAQQKPTANIYVTAPIYVPPPIQQPNNNGPTLGSDKPNPGLNTSFIISPLFILTSGGMKLAWGSGLGPGIYFGQSEHLAVSWFVGVIIGALLAVFLVNKVGKKVIYYAGSLLVIIGGILITSCPINVSVILVARYMDGIANGLTLVTFLSSGGELAVRQVRGMVASMEKLSFSIGYMIESLCGFYLIYIGVQASNQIHGGITIIYGVLALVFNVCFTLESPVYHLLKNNVSEALHAQKKLLAKCKNQDQLSYILLDEHKRLIEDDSSRSKSENIISSIVPIINLSILRSIIALTVSLPLNSMLVLVYALNNGTLYGIFFYGALRFLGDTFGICLIDKIGRKSLSAISIIVCGSLLFACGGLFEANNLNDYFWCVPLLLIIQFFVGIGIDPASSTYLTEAFSVSVKPLCIFIVILIENIVQIITIVIIYSYSIPISFPGIFIIPINYSAFCYAMGSFMFCLLIIFSVILPETRGLKLRLCREQFLKFMPR